MMASDAYLKQQVKRLQRLRSMGRWLMVIVIWSVLGGYAYWALQSEIALWQQHLTLAAIRYGLADNPTAALCLFFCIAITIAVAVWQAQRLILGLPRRERHRLEEQVKTIQMQGKRHFLWKWVIGN